MRIAVIGATNIERVDAGKPRVWTDLLAFLASHARDGVYLDLIGQSPVLPEGWRRVAPNPAGAALRLARMGSALAGGASLQCALLGASGPSRTALIEAEPDLVVYDTIRAAQFLKPLRAIAPKARHVVMLDDLFSQRYDLFLRLAKQGAPLPSPLGRNAKLLPGPIAALAERSVVARAIYAFEAARTRREEIATARAADMSVLLNPTEAEHLGRLSGAPHKVRGVLPLLSQPSTPLPPPEAPGLFLLVGNWTYPPNRDGLDWFLEDILPAVRPETGARFAVVGAGVPEAMKARIAAAGPRVRLTGFVDDLAALYRTASGVFVPARIASGVRIKAIEAWGYGRPVVSTAIGMGPLQAEEGRSVFTFRDAGDVNAALAAARAAWIDHGLAAEIAAMHAQRYSAAALRASLEAALFDRSGAKAA